MEFSSQLCHWQEQVLIYGVQAFGEKDMRVETDADALALYYCGVWCKPTMVYGPIVGWPKIGDKGSAARIQRLACLAVTRAIGSVPSATLACFFQHSFTGSVYKDRRKKVHITSNARN